MKPKNRNDNFARVAIPALLYVTVPYAMKNSERTILKRAAKLIEDAETSAGYLEVEAGFRDLGAGIDATVYPVRTLKNRVALKGATIEDYYASQASLEPKSGRINTTELLDHKILIIDRSTTTI